MRLTIVRGKARVFWHRWFAWRPVRLGGFTWVWLEKVDRRLVKGDPILGRPPRWEYRLPARGRLGAGGEEL